MGWEEACTGREGPLLERLGPGTDAPPSLKEWSAQGALGQLGLNGPVLGWPLVLQVVLGWPHCSTGTLRWVGGVCQSPPCCPLVVLLAAGPLAGASSQLL